MAPIYDFRVADFLPGDFLEVRCAYGYERVIPQTALLSEMRLRRNDRIADLGARLRCRECEERGKVVVRVRWKEDRQYDLGVFGSNGRS